MSINIEIEKKTEKYLNENFNVEYIDGPCFITYKTVDNKIYEKFYTVDSYLYKGIETLKKLDKTAGLK